MFEEFALATGADASSGQSMLGEAEDGTTVNFSTDEIALNGIFDRVSEVAIPAALALGIDFARQRIRRSD